MDAETFILTALTIAERTPDQPEVRQAALTELLNSMDDEELEEMDPPEMEDSHIPDEYLDEDAPLKKNLINTLPKSLFWYVKNQQATAVGVPFKGPSGRWFVKKPDGRVVPYKQKTENKQPKDSKQPGKEGNKKPNTDDKIDETKPDREEKPEGGKRKPGGLTKEELIKRELEVIKKDKPYVKSQLSPKMVDKIKLFFGDELKESSDIPKLVGALGGSEVDVSESYKDGIAIFVNHPAISDQLRIFLLDGKGDVVCSNEVFALKKRHRGSGLGMQVFSDQVRELSSLGVDRIETCAGKGGIMNGYYTWPRLGYDAKLESFWTDDLKIHATETLKKIGVPQEEIPSRVDAIVSSNPQTVQDVMSTADGRDVWKNRGYMERMQFDLKPGSKSLKVLNEYLKSKGKPEIEIDKEKTDKLREERKNRMVESKRPKREEADPKNMESLRTSYFEYLTKYGLDADALLSDLEEKEREFITKYENDDGNNRLMSIARDPEVARRRTLDVVVFNSLRERHQQRMNDPRHENIHKVWEAKAVQEGFDPKEFREMAGMLSMNDTDPDPVNGINQSYKAALTNPGIKRIKN